MKIIIVAIGSQGDVNPFLGVGKALQCRGHDVIVLANRYFEKSIRDSNLQFHEVGTNADYERTTKKLGAKSRAPNLLKRWEYTYFPYIKAVYDFICTNFIKNKTVVLGGTLPFGAWLAKEKLNVPLVMLYLAPFAFRSIYRSPEGYPGLPQWMPKWYKEIYWKLMDAHYDRIVIPTLNKHRAKIGLGPEMPKFMKRRRLYSDKIIGLFPSWFATPQKDWPPQVVLTGFPFFDEELQRESDRERLTNFLAKGDKPIVFTPGTSIRNAGIFFQNSVEVCQKLKKRAIFLTRYREQVPDNLPDNIFYFEYLPFNILLLNAAALVSQGGIGSCAQALRTGVPHLVTPYVNDQFDNASRIKELGVGTQISSKEYDIQNVSNKLDILLSSRAVENRCREFAKKIAESNAVEDTCQIIEKI